MTFTSSLRFLYIFDRSGLLCAVVSKCCLQVTNHFFGKTKNLIAFIAPSKTFVLAQKLNLLNENHLLVWHTVGQIGQKCKETSNLMWMSYLCLFTHIWWIWIHRSMHCDFLGSGGLKETHMDASKPFDSKWVALTMSGGFFTNFAALTHGAALQFPSAQ